MNGYDFALKIFNKKIIIWIKKNCECVLISIHTSGSH